LLKDSGQKNTTPATPSNRPSEAKGPVVQGYWAKKGSATPLSSAPTTSSAVVSPVTLTSNSQPSDDTPKPPVVQGYWASRKEKPTVATSSPLFDNPAPKSDEPKKEVVKGYWARKEERQIKSIWDDQ